MVPTLVLPDGTKLSQSEAIMEYLEEVYPRKESEQANQKEAGHR